MRKILLVLGHPRNDSFCGALAEAYAQGAKESGADIRYVRLADLKFDPILKDDDEQKLEPALKKAQKDILWAEHLVYVFPTWWGSFPALLKGYFDRVFESGFAYKFRKGGLWDRLLKGRTGRLMITMDASTLAYRLTGSPGVRVVKLWILGFCGVWPVAVNLFTKVTRSSPEKRAKYLKKARLMGKIDGISRK